MSFRINNLNNSYLPPVQETQQTRRKSEGQKTQIRQGSFQEVLNSHVQKTNRGIKVSGHASMRLLERNITLNDRDLNALSKAMDKADEKGAKESLMLYRDIAFIASIQNRTLITAMDTQETNENVFTNIDSAVIVK